MKIQLNGKQTESDSHTLADLVIDRGMDSTALIADVNFKVIRQEAWKDITIQEGDTIELLCLVGGG